MKYESVIKTPFVVLLSLALVLAIPTAALGYNYKKDSSTRYWYVTPTYKSYNTGAYNQLGYYLADCYSWMNIACSERAVLSNAIYAQAGITVASSNGTQSMEWGDRVTNPNGSSAGQYITASKEQSIKWSQGASAWGYGQVRSANLSYNDVTSDDIFLIFLNDTGITSLSDDQAEAWDSGLDNFVGDDGLVYGVPYTDENGTAHMPDMGRVTATNGEIGYVSISEIDNYFESETEDEIDARRENNALCLKNAFAEFYGMDALDIDTAKTALSEMCYAGGYGVAINIIQESTSDTICTAINNGSLHNVNTLEAVKAQANTTNSSNSFLINETDFETIYNNARTEMSIAFNVYDELGNIIGVYKFAAL